MTEDTRPESPSNRWRSCDRRSAWRLNSFSRAVGRSAMSESKVRDSSSSERSHSERWARRRMAQCETMAFSGMKPASADRSAAWSSASARSTRGRRNRSRAWRSSNSTASSRSASSDPAASPALAYSAPVNGSLDRQATTRSRARSMSAHMARKSSAVTSFCGTMYTCSVSLGTENRSTMRPVRRLSARYSPNASSNQPGPTVDVASSKRSFLCL